MLLPIIPDSYHHRLHYIVSRVTSYRYQSAETLSHLDPADIPRYEQLTAHYAEAEQAGTRIDVLSPLRQKRQSKQTTQIVKYTVIVVGALVVSKAAQLVASLIIPGPASVFVGLAIGAVWAGFTHDRATKGLAELRCKNSSQKAIATLKKLERDDPHPNFLTQTYYHARQQLILKVEESSLTKIFSGDMAVAIAASAIEILVTFWITLPSGVILAIILALFPVILIWLAAYWHSEHVNLAVWAGDMIGNYETYLPDAEVSDETLIEIVEADSHFRYLTGVAPNGINSLQAAENKAIADLSSQHVHDWHQARLVAKEQRTQEYRQKVDEILRTHKPCAGRRAHENPIGYSEQIDELLRIEKQRYEDDLKHLDQSYDHVVKGWENRRQKAQENPIRREASNQPLVIQ